jgi:hypothetical protein
MHSIICHSKVAIDPVPQANTDTTRWTIAAKTSLLVCVAFLPLTPQAQEQRLLDYNNVLIAALTWEGRESTARSPEVPYHFPLAIQNTWVSPRPSKKPSRHSTDLHTTTSSGSSSSSRSTISSSGSSSSGGGRATAAAEAGQSQGYLRGEEIVLTPEEVKAVVAVGRAMKELLGVDLPERGRKGLRGLVVASLNPVSVQQRLRAWVDVCGQEYVRQVGLGQC